VQCGVAAQSEERRRTATREPIHRRRSLFTAATALRARTPARHGHIHVNHGSYASVKTRHPERPDVENSYKKRRARSGADMILFAAGTPSITTTVETPTIDTDHQTFIWVVGRWRCRQRV
jgi:hypothetical protein